MLKGGDYSRVGSLAEAVEVCRRSLAGDGREDYARLVTEERVRAAIGTALERHRRALEKRSMTYGPDYPWVRDGEVEKKLGHFGDVVKPVFVNSLFQFT